MAGQRSHTTIRICPSTAPAPAFGEPIRVLFGQSKVQLLVASYALAVLTIIRFFDIFTVPEQNSAPRVIPTRFYPYI